MNRTYWTVGARVVVIPHALYKPWTGVVAAVTDNHVIVRNDSGLDFRFWKSDGASVDEVDSIRSHRSRVVLAESAEGQAALSR